MGENEMALVGHSGGAAQILKSRGSAGPKNEFEQKLMLSLRGPVVRSGNQRWQVLVDNLTLPDHTSHIQQQSDLHERRMEGPC